MATALSQLEEAHRALGGAGVGRRTNTLQLNYAFVLLLSAHFQAFCRDLHSEAVVHVQDALGPSLGAVVSDNLTLRRQLDSRNAQPGSIGTDFGRLGSNYGRRWTRSTCAIRSGEGSLNA